MKSCKKSITLGEDYYDKLSIHTVVLYSFFYDSFKRYKIFSRLYVVR